MKKVYKNKNKEMKYKEEIERKTIFKKKELGEMNCSNIFYNNVSFGVYDFFGFPEDIEYSYCDEDENQTFYENNKLFNVRYNFNQALNKETFFNAIENSENATLFFKEKEDYITFNGNKNTVDFIKKECFLKICFSTVPESFQEMLSGIQTSLEMNPYDDVIFVKKLFTFIKENLLEKEKKERERNPNSVKYYIFSKDNECLCTEEERLNNLCLDNKYIIKTYLNKKEDLLLFFFLLFEKEIKNPSLVYFYQTYLEILQDVKEFERNYHFDKDEKDFNDSDDVDDIDKRLKVDEEKMIHCDLVTWKNVIRYVSYEDDKNGFPTFHFQKYRTIDDLPSMTNEMTSLTDEREIIDIFSFVL